jgi:hypothetical protein
LQINCAKSCVCRLKIVFFCTGFIEALFPYFFIGSFTCPSQPHVPCLVLYLQISPLITKTACCTIIIGHQVFVVAYCCLFWNSGRLGPLTVNLSLFFWHLVNSFSFRSSTR